MPKVKIPRKSTIVDMTAMCDVSFLLLTFFILTAKFRPNAAVTVDVPVARSEKTFKNALTILVDPKGRSYVSLNEAKLRYAMLEQMNQKYGAKYPELAKLTDKQKNTFALDDTWGTPVEDMGRVLSMNGREFTDYQQKQIPGIPYDSLHNQLGDWVQAARYAAQETGDGTPIKIAIKSDKNTTNRYIKEIVKTLTERDIHTFLLITTLAGSEKGDQGGAAAAAPDAEKKTN
jgi:biopolymer transport protein ExbD